MGLPPRKGRYLFTTVPGGRCGWDERRGPARRVAVGLFHFHENPFSHPHDCLPFHRFPARRGETESPVLRRGRSSARPGRSRLGHRQRWREGHRRAGQAEAHHHREKRRMAGGPQALGSRRPVHHDHFRRQHRHREQPSRRRGLGLLRAIQHGFPLQAAPRRRRRRHRRRTIRRSACSR